MAKKASPWYWEARNGWYVLVGGKRHFLGEHPRDVAKPEKSKKTGRWNSPTAIAAAFRRLIEAATAPSLGDERGVDVLDDFIVWTKET